MPYVKRDQQNNIIARYNRPQSEDQEYVSDDDAEISALDLAGFKKTKIESLAESLSLDINSGFESDALGATHHYDSEQHNIDWIQAASVSDVDSPVTCDDLDGNEDSKQPRNHTSAQCLIVLKDGMSALLAHKTKFRTLRDQVLAAADEAAVNAINW